MGKALANAADWYVNSLNKAKILPVNIATLIRDVLAKQLGGPGFRPRPLTEENFTKPELEVIRRLIKNRDESGAIRGGAYSMIADKKGKDYFVYGDVGHKLLEYLTPIRSVSTTIGQASARPEKGDILLKDTYDFNTNNQTIVNDNGSYFVPSERKQFSSLEEAKEYLSKYSARVYGDTYGRIRANASAYGHASDDPDSEKIHASLSLNKINKMLGEDSKKYDINTPMSKNRFIINSALAGAAGGAPIGAAMGALSGSILLLDKKRRKKWIKTMLLSTLGGTAIGAAAFGIGGGLAGAKLLKIFGRNELTKKSSGEVDPAERKKAARRRQIRSALITLLAIATPGVAMAGLGAYAAGKGANLYKKMTAAGNDNADLRTKVVVGDTQDYMYSY